MIVGIGTDIVNVTRIEKLLGKFGDKFLERVFTEQERKDSHRYDKQGNFKAYAAHFAKRFAAKEACAKALGTGFRDGLNFRDFEVIRGAYGKPSIRLYGKAFDKYASGYNFHLSMSDDYPAAVAIVVVEE